VQQSAKFIPTQLQVLQNKKNVWLVIVGQRFLSLQLFDEAFSTFRVRFVKKINVVKITKVFVNFF